MSLVVMEMALQNARRLMSVAKNEVDAKDAERLYKLAKARVERARARQSVFDKLVYIDPYHPELGMKWP